MTGASTGIEKRSPPAWACGARLILAARSKEKLEELAIQLRGPSGPEAVVIAMDLAAPGAAVRLGEEAVRRGLTVDLLIDDAGFGKWGNFLDESVETYAEMVDLNIRAVVELCHVFLPAMAAKGDCGILNVGSTGSFVPVPWAAVYGATKAFVFSFSEALYYEYTDRGVQDTAHCPGNTGSDFARVANPAAENGAKAGDFAGNCRRGAPRCAPERRLHRNSGSFEPTGGMAAQPPLAQTRRDHRRRNLAQDAPRARGRGVSEAGRSGNARPCSWRCLRR